ncbi:MAG: GxxExxY protein [Candidatus Cloacimonetes bacterium]|nr:GxxExxY protein [Candidatus Cloacimonadota bacterium]
MEYKFSDLTKNIIHCFYKVYNKLGYGFLEKVYENSLKFELESKNYKVESQKPIKVYYREQLVGEYFADLVVDDKIIIELKANKFLSPEDDAQILNYLKATKYEIGLILNFGIKPEIRRKIYSLPEKQKNIRTHIKVDLTDIH